MSDILTTEYSLYFKLAWATYERGDTATIRVTDFGGGVPNTPKYVVRTLDVEIPLNDALSYIQDVEKKGNGFRMAALLYKKGKSYSEEFLRKFMKIESCEMFAKKCEY